jgi:hypothetical protein
MVVAMDHRRHLGSRLKLLREPLRLQRRNQPQSQRLSLTKTPSRRWMP